MLDIPCKTHCSDGSSLPRLQNGVIVARCQCGTILEVATAITSAGHCPTCNLSATEGITTGPDWRQVRELLYSRRQPHDLDNVVYFARIAQVIKIGTTGSIHDRMKQLGSPELLGVIAGGYQVETRMHHRFVHLRIRGELFREAPDLLAFIEASCYQPAAPPPRPPRQTPDHDWWPAKVRTGAS